MTVQNISCGFVMPIYRRTYLTKSPKHPTLYWDKHNQGEAQEP